MACNSNLFLEQFGQGKISYHSKHSYFPFLSSLFLHFRIVPYETLLTCQLLKYVHALEQNPCLIFNSCFVYHALSDPQRQSCIIWHYVKKANKKHAFYL